MKITRYTLVQRDGVWLDHWTAQLWDKLVKKFPGLQLTQGVRSGAKASGGTHLGLGVLDFYLGKWFSKRAAVVRYAFDIGFFGWYRPELWQNGVRVWKAHVHLGVRGCIHAAQSLKNQFASWLRKRNGLQGDGKDPFTYRPKNASKAAPYKPVPLKAEKPIFPWFNVSYQNTWWNSVAGGKPERVEKTAPGLAKASAAGSPAIASFAEVRASQLEFLDPAMAKYGYSRVCYSKANMLAAYARPGLTDVRGSFSKFSKQHGGNVEGVLRLRFKAKGSWAQVGILHLDFNSPESYKAHNLKQAVAALGRWGAPRLGTQWKSRTVIIGDINDDDVAAKVLKPLGFKCLFKHGIDQIWVGATRVTRGGDATDTSSDHPRILGRIGRKTEA